ncbi:MAG: MFS transporter [Aggregatilineales bacterium]
MGRYRLGLVLPGGALLAAAGLLGYALSPSWILLLIIAFFMAAGKGTLDAGLNNFVSANYGTSAMNWLHASWGIGLTVAPYVVTFIVITLSQSWRVGYALAAGMMFLMMAILVLTRSQWRLDTDSELDETGNTVKRKNTPAMDSMRDRAVFISIVFFFIYGGVEIGVGQLANTLLVESRNIPQETASTWVSIYWGTFTLGRMLIGVIALRFSDRTIMSWSMALTLIGAALLVWNAFPEMGLMGLMGIGFGLAAMFPILIAQTPGRVGRDHAANAIGFQVGFAGFGGAIIPGIISFVAARAGLEFISTLILMTTLVMIVTYQIMRDTSTGRKQATST